MTCGFDQFDHGSSSRSHLHCKLKYKKPHSCVACRPAVCQCQWFQVDHGSSSRSPLPGDTAARTSKPHAARSVCSSCIP
eukprot:62373-Rhodomonas_salina.1